MGVLLFTVCYSLSSFWFYAYTSAPTQSDATGIVHVPKINEVPFVPSVSIRKYNITCILLNRILHMFFKNARQCQVWAFFSRILHVVY